MIRKSTPFLRRSRRRGFTLVEMSIAMGVSGLVMVAVASLQLISARQVKDIYATSRTRASRMRALDQIRYRLVNCKIGTAVVTDSNHRIRFRDPNVPGNVISEFNFIPSTRTLYYDRNVADSNPRIIASQGPIDVTFTLVGVANKETMCILKVKSAANVAYGDVDTQEGETQIYFRNK